MGVNYLVGDTFYRTLTTILVMNREQNFMPTLEIPETNYFSPHTNHLIQTFAMSEAAHHPNQLLNQKEQQLLMQERRRYKTIGVLQARCQACLAQKRWETGIKLARYWLEIDRLNEEPLRCLMKMLVGDNRPQEALRQYEWYQWWLSAELAIEPEQSTQNLAHQIAAQHPPTTTQPPHSD